MSICECEKIFIFFSPCINLACYRYADHIFFFQKLIYKIINTNLHVIDVLKLSINRKQKTQIPLTAVVYHPQLKFTCHKQISLYAHRKVTFCNCINIIKSISTVTGQPHVFKNAGLILSSWYVKYISSSRPSVFYYAWDY